eukprot:s978_g26.t1
MSLWDEFENDCFGEPEVSNDATDFLDSAPQNPEPFIGETNTPDVLEETERDGGYDNESDINNSFDFLPDGHDDDDDDEAIPQVPQSFAGKRKRGRPKGTFGDRAVRARQHYLRDLQQAQVEAQQPTPGTIWYARQFRGGGSNLEVAKRKEEPERTSLKLLSSSSLLWTSLEDVGTPLQQHIVNAAKYSFRNQPTSERDSSLAAKLMDLKSQAVMSNKAIGAFLQQDTDQRVWNVGTQNLEVSSAVVLAGGVLWGGFLQTVFDAIRAERFKGVLFLEKMRYDETPLKVRLTDQVEQQGRGPSNAEVAQQGKVLQIESSLYMLVADPSSGKQLLVSGMVPSILQCVDRTTAECTLRAIQNVRQLVPEMAKAAQEFEHRIRVAAARFVYRTVFLCS